MPQPTPEQFATWLARQGKSPATVYTYVRIAEPLWTSFDRMRGAIEAASRRTATEVAGGSRAPASGNVVVAALRSIVEFLRAQGVSVSIELNSFPSERRAAVPLPPAELDRLLDAPTSAAKPPLVQARDAALLAVLASATLRVAQVAALRRSDVAAHSLPLSNHARHWLSVYLGRRRDTASALFVRHDRAGTGEPKPLTPRSIERIVRHYAVAAGIAGPVTPERIRVTVRAAAAER